MPDIPATGDVVIIGAGLSGALIARYLAEARLQVVVLEAKDMAKATGGGPRVAFVGTPQPYTALQAQFGAEKARQLWRATLDNLEEGRRLLEMMGVPYRRCGALRLAGNTEEAYALQRSAAALQKAGFEAELEDATDLGFVAALRTEDDMAFDVGALIRRLLSHERITVQDRTEVESIEVREKDVLIWARGAYLRSPAAIIAAGAYATHLHPYLAQHMRVMPAHTVECRAEGALPEQALAWNEGRLSLQPSPDKGLPRLAAWVRGADDELWPLLESAAATFCPQTVVEALWGTWLAEGEDGLPLVGEIPQAAGLYTVGGLGGWGLSWAFVAAKRLAALMLDDVTPTWMEVGRFAT